MPRPTGERARAACRDNYALGKASGPGFIPDDYSSFWIGIIQITALRNGSPHRGLYFGMSILTVSTDIDPVKHTLHSVETSPHTPDVHVRSKRMTCLSKCLLAKPVVIHVLFFRRLGTG